MCTVILSHRNSVEFDSADRPATMKTRASGTGIHILQTLVLALFCMIMNNSAFAQDKKTGDKKTEADKTYGTDDKGKTGKKTTGTEKVSDKDEGEYTEIFIKVYDPRGTLRETHLTKIYVNEGKRKEEFSHYYDCNGLTSMDRAIHYDILGNEEYFFEMRFIAEGEGKGSRVVSGFIREIDSNGKKHIKRFNSKTREFEEVALNTTPESNEINFEPDKSTCPVSYMANEIGISFTLIREDSQPDPFNTLGGSFSYTRFLSGVFGLTGDIDATFKSQTGQDLSKYTFLAGVTVLPFPDNGNTDNLSIFAHALAGESSLINKYGSSKFTDHAFTLDLGAGLMVNLNKNFGIGFNADYMHTNFGNEPQNDFKVSVGAALKIGEITGPKKIRWAPEKKFN